MDQTALAKTKQADVDAKAVAVALASVSASEDINNENLKQADLSCNRATKGLDYEAEITCANCSA